MTRDEIIAANPLKDFLPTAGVVLRGDRAKTCPRKTHEGFDVAVDFAKNVWNCHACGIGGSFLDWIAERDNVPVADVLRQYGSNGHGQHRPAVPVKRTEPPPAPPADLSAVWREAVTAFDQKHVDRLAAWRGLSVPFCQWLKERELVGVHQGNLALPVHGDAGKVTALHIRTKDAGWFYHPKGAKTGPLVLGDSKTADMVLVFESQWDAFAILDKLPNWSKDQTPPAIVTRGAGNGKLVRGLIKRGAVLLAFKQNDEPAGKWLVDIAATATADGAMVRSVPTPAEFKDANDWTKAGATAADIFKATEDAVEVKPTKTAPTTNVPAIQFFSPSELRDYRPPDGHVLVGDCHIVRGNTTVIGGAPGVGKSRAAVALAQAGAIGADWFGLKVHQKFKTLVIQNENGRFRLSREFADMDCPALEGSVRVCEPPPFGLAFDNAEFTTALVAEFDAFKPDVVVLDPWNAVAGDDRAREYLETFKLIRSVLPVGDAAPALVIVAHTRKPKADERATGRGLLNLLAGSYVLGSVPRCVFVLQSASDDPEDNCVVWTCCKNNDGELGGRSAWQRRNGLFAPVTDFDWTAFDTPAGERPTVTVADLAAVLDNGNRQLRKAELVSGLIEHTGAGKSCCYAALKKFGQHLEEVDGLWRWKK